MLYNNVADMLWLCVRHGCLCAFSLLLLLLLVCGRPQVCGMLLKAGADSGLCDADGNTAAQVAPKGWTCWDQ